MPEPDLTWPVWGSAFVEVCLGFGLVWALARRTPEEQARQVKAWTVLWAGLALAVSFGLKGALMRAFVSELNFFGQIHLLYVDLVVVIPAIALLLWSWHFVRLRRGLLQGALTKGARWWLGLALVPALVGVYATFIEPFRLQAETVSVVLPSERAVGPPIRVGVLADLQTDRITEYEHEAVTQLLALNPDLIVLPGDLFHGSVAELDAALPALHALLSRLEAPGGVFFVPGNTDWTSHLETVVEGTGVELLLDDVRHLEIHGRPVMLGGVDIAIRSNLGGPVIRTLEDTPGTDDIRILVAHFPDWIYELRPQSRVDLTISGHTHGGQVRIPFFGPPIVLSSVPRRVGGGGLHELDGRRIYVSRGVGLERGQAPRIRFLTPPCVSVLVLE